MSDRQDGAARYGVDSKAQWEIHGETNAGTGGYKAMEQLWEFESPRWCGHHPQGHCNRYHAVSVRTKIYIFDDSSITSYKTSVLGGYAISSGKIVKKIMKESKLCVLFPTASQSLYGKIMM